MQLCQREEHAAPQDEKEAHRSASHEPGPRQQAPERLLRLPRAAAQTGKDKASSTPAVGADEDRRGAPYEGGDLWGKERPSGEAGR